MINAEAPAVLHVCAPKEASHRAARLVAEAVLPVLEKLVSQRQYQ